MAEPRRVWILTLEGLDAMEDPYVHTAPYSSEQRALAAMLDWLKANGCTIPASLVVGNLTHEAVGAIAQEHFDGSEPTCGPQSWSLECLELDKPFHDTEDMLAEEENAGLELNFLKKTLESS